VPARTFGPDAPKGGSRGKKGRRERPDQDAVRENVLKTLQGMKGPGGKKGGRRSDEPSYRELQAGLRAEERERAKTQIRVNEFISVSELADLMKVPATQIVQFAFKELGLMVTVNQRLDFDQIELIASAFGFEAVKESEYAAGVEVAAEVEEEGALVPRPPVVTIMGHVDHGKTSLLDYIRKANVVAGEAGGITQHIGAYHIEYKGRAITFLDTPGHQAFTAMRARGAQVTDIVVLVVAADDQVMPQTIEAISHAKNAGVPMIVAINKIDLPAANPGKVKQDLLQHSVVLEEFGGTTLHAEISAKKGIGIEHLLEQILLQADILELKASAEAKVLGTVLEATLDPGKGPLATILVQKGTLKTGADFICGKFSGRVRAMFDERGKQVKSAGPSIPVQILGFEGVPSAGDTFHVVADASEAREIAQKRQRLEREAQSRRGQRGGTLEDFSRALKEGAVSALRVIIKADQGGPAEALADALAQLSTPEVRVDVIHRGVGAITENDILLAKASTAIVLGFHVRPDANARNAAEREGVDVRTYRIIYDAVEDVKKALEGLLKPEEKEIVLGDAEVRELFKVSKIGTVAGCMVTSGTIQKTGKVRVVRDGQIVYTGMLASLKRFKDDAKEVKEGMECGMSVENFNDLKIGDRIECFRLEEVKRTLAASSAGAS
jgi:translation initiation factor IF-2